MLESNEQKRKILEKSGSSFKRAHAAKEDGVSHFQLEEPNPEHEEATDKIEDGK